MNKPKILIFSYYDTRSHHGCSYPELAKITMPSYEEYCKIHNYDFYVKTDNFETKRSIGWAKYDIFLDKMDFYDWIMYVECDSMLLNETIRLENLIDDNYDIIVSETKRQDKIQLSTGTMLVKCSQWNKDFFNYLLTKENYWNGNMHEQAALSEEINNEENIRKHISIKPLRFFNAFAHKWHEESNFQTGDFICHAPGCSNDYRVQLFNYLKNHIIKMPKEKINYKPFLNIGDEP